jgi:biotin synthesis protein BioG
MQHYWLNKCENESLIIFFGGWGTDYHPFLPIQSQSYDVVMFYDYKTMELPVDFECIIKSYKKVTIIGWSLGVWVANEVCQPFINYFNRGIAINGTLDPISDTNGIPLEVFEGTLSNLSPLNLIKFNRRILQLPDERKQFETNVSQRRWDDLRDELAHLRQAIVPAKNHLFQFAIVGTNDLIFQHSNQLNFWHDKLAIVEMPVSHFPFYSFNSWDVIMNSINTMHA